MYKINLTKVHRKKGKRKKRSKIFSTKCYSRIRKVSNKKRKK